MEPIEPFAREIEAAVLGYVSAWNAIDPREVDRRLERCFAVDGVIHSNFERIEGRAALAARIKAWRAQNPKNRAVFTAGIEQHHRFFRFAGIVFDADGKPYSPALDVGEIDEQGLIRQIITFHLEMPPVPTHWPREVRERVV